MLGIYTRLSVDDSESNSIKNQLREGKYFAENNKYPFKLYDEGMGVSGGDDIANRPLLTELINDIIKGVVTAVWLRDQNRLERNQLTFHVFVDLVKKKGVKIFIADIEINYNDPDTFFRTSLDSLYNTKKRFEQSISTKRALHDNLKEGKSRGGIMAYGYTKDANRYVIIDEDEAKVIHEIYSLSLNGKGTRAIATILNERDIPTRYKKMEEGTLKVKNKYTGKITVKKKSEIQWAQNTIRSILRNPLYKGDKYLGKGEERKLYKYPIIIDENLWEQVQETLDKNKVLTGKKVDHKYLLKGILECGICSRNYYGKINNNTNIYMCSSRRMTKGNCGNRGINISALEAYIWGTLFMEKGIKKALLEHLKGNDKEEKVKGLIELLSKQEKELAGANEEKKRAIRYALNGTLTEEDVKPEIQRLDSLIKESDMKCKNVKKQLKDFENVAKKEKEIQVDLNNLNDISHNTKRDVIKKYIGRIEVVYNEPIFILKVQYNFQFEESHILPKDYKFGVIMHTRKAYPLKKDIDVEKELNKLEKELNKLHGKIEDTAI